MCHLVPTEGWLVKALCGHWVNLRFAKPSNERKCKVCERRAALSNIGLHRHQQAGIGSMMVITVPSEDAMSEIGYQLFVVDKPETPANLSLEEALKAARPHIENKAKVRIESFAETSVSRVWHYDYGEHGWVEGRPRASALQLAQNALLARQDAHQPAGQRRAQGMTMSAFFRAVAWLAASLRAR